MSDDFWLDIDGEINMRVDAAIPPVQLVFEELRDVEPLDSQFGAWPKDTVPKAL